MPKNKTATDVDAYCSHCRLDLAHVVVAMEGSRVARVQCKTCRTVHAFRDKSAAARRGASGAPRTTRASAKASAMIADYDELMRGHDIARARRYKPSVTFGAGDVVDHPTFGLGLVVRVLSDDKLEVTFRDGSRVLVHARG